MAVPVPVDQFSARVQRQYQESLRHQPSLPDVDAKADNYLDQLFAWGDAFVATYGVSAAEIDRAERRAESLSQDNEDRH